MQVVSQDPALVGRRLVLLGMGANLILALIKIIAGVLGRSQALLADGIESSMDVLSSLMVWGALKVSVRPPDQEHPYGHGKIESLAALLGALALLGASGLIALQSGSALWRAYFTETGAPHPPAPFTLFVLVLVMLVKWVLARRMSREASAVQSQALQTDAWHHRSDALTSAAAFLGISLSLLGGPAWATADSWAALFCCAIICLNAILMFRQGVGEVIDEQGSDELIQNVVRTVEAVPGVSSTEKCRVRKSGLNRIADLHVRVNGSLSVSDGHHIAHAVVHALREGNFQLSDVTVHIEPEPDIPTDPNQRANEGGNK
jgi:cation diffusion facilitator family transporter